MADARRIVITSGKGGVGKTTVTANIGASLARLGRKVVVMDMDIGLNNLDVALGLESNVVYTLGDVIENRCRAKQALLEVSGIPNLYLMPSAQRYEGGKLSGQNIRYVVECLAPTFDYILLDCPAGIEIGFHRAVASVGEAIIVTTPHISALRDADKVLSILESYETEVLGLVVNRARGDLIVTGDMIAPQEIGEILKTKVIGALPEDDEVVSSGTIGVCINPKSKIGMSFERLAKSIDTGAEVVFDVTKQYKGFFGAIKRKARRIGS